MGDLDVVKFAAGYSVNAEEDAKGRFSLYFGPLHVVVVDYIDRTHEELALKISL